MGRSAAEYPRECCAGSRSNTGSGKMDECDPIVWKPENRKPACSTPRWLALPCDGSENPRSETQIRVRCRPRGRLQPSKLPTGTVFTAKDSTGKIYHGHVVTHPARRLLRRGSMRLVFDDPVVPFTNEGVFRAGNKMRLLKLGGSLAAGKLA